MESIAQVQIHEFESEMEWAYYELQTKMGEALHDVVRAFEPDIISWREFCAPGTGDIEHAFLICLSDKLDNGTSVEEQVKLRKVIQATLQWMRINGTLV